MAVYVDNASGNSVTVNTVYNSVNVLPDENSTVVEILTPGPQGPIGPQGPAGPSGSIDSGSFVTTSSFDAFTSSYYADSASFDNSISFLSSSFTSFSGSYNTFSSSYNTGSFTGSFTGYFEGFLNGLANEAEDAFFAYTSSYSSNIAGITGYIPLFISDNEISTSAMHQSNSYSIIINREFGTALNPEALFVFQPNTESINVATFESNVDNYSQINVRNESAGEFASTDIVATANNGDEFYFYVNLGINSSNYDPGFIGGANDAYLYSLAKNFHIGNAAADGSHLGFFVGGDNVDTYNKLTLSPDNLHEMTGSLDISNFLLIRNGLTVQNGTTQQDVLTVSESIVRIVPNASDPTGTTDAGSIWFTSTAMYVGLE